MTGTGFFYLIFYMIPWNFEAFQAIWHIQLGSGSHLTLFISGQKLPVSQKGENWKNEIREIKGVRIVRIFSYFFWIITIIMPTDSKKKIWTFLLKLGILGFFRFRKVSWFYGGFYHSLAAVFGFYIRDLHRIYQRRA